MFNPSLIKHFYTNKSIFITGATGFIGKVLLIKLLLSCPNIANIYVLLRTRHNRRPQERLDALLDEPPFCFCDALNRQKIVAIEGDITLPELGLSQKDRQLLIDEVSVVFHCAASIKFDAPLSESLQHNVIGTKEVVELFRQSINLDCFVHVSTAYAYCHQKELFEEFYPVTCDPSTVLQLAESCPPHLLCKIAPFLMENRPNTYTYTKALAEHLVRKSEGQFPIAIVRPSIIMNSLEEPVPGWVDNINGPSGITVLASVGILRTVDWDYFAKVDLVPVDKVVNALIAIGWDTAVQRENSIKIYNVVSSDCNPITWGKLFEIGRVFALEAPSIKTVRPLINPPKSRGPQPFLYPIRKFIYQTVFAFIIDVLLTLIGYPAIMSRLTKKMHYAFNVMDYFTQHEWDFHSTNLSYLSQRMTETDRKEFDFAMNMEWKSYLKIMHLGNRRYLLKEKDCNIPKAQKRMFLITVAYTALQLIFYLALVYLIYAKTNCFYYVKNGFSYFLIQSCKNVESRGVPH